MTFPLGMIGLNGLIFTHPLAGGLALLGIPAVIAIHFLQLPSRPVAVSTLFLLERLDPKSLDGSRMQRLRQSVPLWLQILAVLLISWLLAAPRWVRPDSTQTLLVLLDSSVSMRAFSEPLRVRLPERLRALAHSAAKTEWLLLETDPAASRLYAGGRLEELEAALDRWKPRLGRHDFGPALRLGQSLVQGRGLVVFVTDRSTPLPPGVELFAVGRPLENAGFAGARATAEGWEALVKNYGNRPQTRAWWLEDEKGEHRSPEETVALQPGQVQTLRGRFPDQSGAIRLVLGGGNDGFDFDDRLPLVRPEPKRLRVKVEGVKEETGWLEALLRSEPALERVTENADLHLVSYDPLAPRLPAGPAIVFVNNPAPGAKLLQGRLVAERDPWVSGLGWDGLLVTDSFGLPRKPGDSVLLWQGERPLVFRRGTQLLIGFDPAQSNAPRLPAFVLLLHRYLEAVRQERVAPEVANFELNQPLRVANHGGPLRTEGQVQTGEGGTNVRAPADPGFFEIRENDEMRVKGAAHFADPREADFREAATVDHLEETARREQERHSRQDGLTPIWVLLFGAVLVVNWNWNHWRAPR